MNGCECKSCGEILAVFGIGTEPRRIDEIEAAERNATDEELHEDVRATFEARVWLDPNTTNATEAKIAEQFLDERMNDPEWVAETKRLSDKADELMARTSETRFYSQNEEEK